MREDGGEAGLHPSNIHDNAYAIGTLDLTGDQSILLGPDGPSLGGFVCPVTTAKGEMWKLGQLHPGDKVHFQLLTLEQAETIRKIKIKISILIIRTLFFRSLLSLTRHIRLWQRNTRQYRLQNQIAG